MTTGPRRISLRLALTLLYATLMVAILAGAAGAAGAAYGGVRGIMLHLVDASLQEALLAAAQEVEYEDGTPGFDDPSIPDEDPIDYRVVPSEDRVMVAWITDLDGTVIDIFGEWIGPVWPLSSAGARDVRTKDGARGEYSAVHFSPPAPARLRF